MTKSNKTLLVAGSVCLSIFIWSIYTPEAFRAFFAEFTTLTLDFFGHYYLYLGFGIVGLLILLALLPQGKIYLGDEPPAYNRYAWISMLFSTGMGPGLMLRAVQEPVYYYLHPPLELGYDPVSYALAYTFFHWGLTPWAFYSLFGLVIAYFVYVRQKRLLPSAVLVENEPAAIGVDTIIIICTIIGVMSSVGLGSRQLLEGINYVSGSNWPVSGAIGLVLFIVLLSVFSARSGLGKSIKNLSTLNITLTLALLIYVIFNSHLPDYFRHLAEGIGIYVKDFLPMSLNLGSHQVDRPFLLNWTYFYWAFWLAWVPFTGVFIARISKGRSIREYVAGTLLIPSAGTFFWFTAFGQKAINSGLSPEHLAQKYESIYSAIFVFFNDMPGGLITTSLSLLLLFTFLITSVDSAIFVLSMFSDDGSEDPDQHHRLVWGLALGGLTAALLWVGQETLLKASSQLLISFALPFSFLYLWFIIIFLRSLFKRHAK